MAEAGERVRPYGSWPSPITAASLVEGAAGVGEIRADGEDVWWSEQRPSEGGRTQLVRHNPEGNRHDLFPPYVQPPSSAPVPGEGGGGAGDGPSRNWNARTALLEYGGGAWAVRDGVVVFADWADQRLHRVDRGGDPVAISPAPTVARGFRWSEPTWLDDRWLVCVRESHDPDAVAANDEAMDELVAIPFDGSAVEDPALVRVLVSGPDFVHSPAIHGDRLAWIQWDHPRMPWEGSELVVATIERDADGAPVGVGGAQVVAGGPAESIVQPGFVTNGDLVFCTDRTGWWQPWRVAAATGPDSGSAGPVPVLADPTVEVEVGGPLWVGGLRWWAELEDGRLAVSLAHDAAVRLGVVEVDGTLTEVATPFTEVSQVVASGDRSDALVVAATPVSEPAPYRVAITEWHEPDLGDPDVARGNDPDAPMAALSLLRPERDLGFGTEWFSQPTHVTFASEDGRTAHGLHYPPHSPDTGGPVGEQPPLVVMVHGGPTSSARHTLSLAKQFWTSRGFAVIDVDHGGSSGYGRPYRELLAGRWGVVDVEDAVAAARHLADSGHADPERLAIRGGSAGGFTTLAALCFHDVFAAGASHYGVADLAALATETHKFESRYLDGLVGPWPEAEATYAERSPIHHTEGFAAPLIVFQGSEDEVVPPAQAEMIVAALADKGVPHAYLLFDGEQHGFRHAANIVRALEAELWFYGKVFGFQPADDITPVEGAVGL